MIRAYGKNGCTDTANGYHDFVMESYRQGLSVSDISKITGLGWTQIGQMVQEGIKQKTLPNAEQHRNLWKHRQVADIQTLAMLQSIVETISKQSKVSRQVILRRLLSLVTVVLIGWAAFVFWGNSVQADVLSEIKNALKKNQWVKYRILSGPFAGEIYWRRFNPEVYAKIRTNGEILYITQNPARGLLYDPQSNSIRSLEDKGSQYLLHDMTTLLDFFEYIVGRKFSGSETFRYYKGEDEDVIEFVKKNGLAVLRCDPINHLPSSLVDPEFSCAFEYSQNGPRDIYALGVPDDNVFLNANPVGR